MGSEYCHVEKAVSPGRFRCSPDGQRLHMQHGMPGPRHWERTFTYWELAQLAERVATWDAGWALGRAVELVEAEVYRIEGSFDGAEKRRSGMTMGRVPWLFDEKGDYRTPAPRAERSRTAAALEAW